jgi:hypothetical protein
MSAEFPPQGLSESNLAEMWRTMPNPQPMADQIPTPEWEDLLRADSSTGTLVPSGIRLLHDPDVLGGWFDVYVGDSCGISRPWSPRCRGHVHVDNNQWSMCVRPPFVFNRARRYSVHLLHEVAHILVGYTPVETHGELWHAVCSHLGHRVGLHALHHRLALAMGHVWSPEDEGYWDGATDCAGR